MFQACPGAQGIICLAIFSFSAICTNASLGSDDAIRERFLNEAPKKWAEYRKIVSHHSDIIATYEISSNLGTTTTEKDSFYLNLDRGAAGCFHDDTGDANVWNPEYRFQIAKGNEGRWKLEKMSHKPSQFPDDLIGRSLSGSARNQRTAFGIPMEAACLGQTIWGDWLPYLISSDDFKLLRMEELGGNGQLVKATFGFGPKVAHPIMNGGGMVILDTKHYWLIREAEIDGHYYDLDKKKTLKITNEFKEFDDGGVQVPYVSHHVMELLVPEGNKGEKFEQKWTIDIGMAISKDLDGKQFYLSHYGLPEPMEKEGTMPVPTLRRSSGVLQWGAFAVLGILAIIFVRRRIVANRRKPKSNEN